MNAPDLIVMICAGCPPAPLPAGARVSHGICPACLARALDAEPPAAVAGPILHVLQERDLPDLETITGHGRY